MKSLHRFSSEVKPLCNYPFCHFCQFNVPFRYDTFTRSFLVGRALEEKPQILAKVILCFKLLPQIIQTTNTNAFKADLREVFFFPPPDLPFDSDISHNIYTSQGISKWKTLQKWTAGRVILDWNFQTHLQPVSCSEQMSGFNLCCLHWSTEKGKEKKQEHF